MTRIDFHSNVPDRLQFAYRLVRKARGANHNLVLLLRDQQDMAAFDNAFWTMGDIEFLPHVRAGDPLASSTPIILTDSDDAELPHHNILINLSDRTPAHFARFERLLEIVSSEAAETQAGRERYRFYMQRGYPLNHYPADKA